MSTLDVYTPTTTTETPANTQPLHGGNVYFLNAEDDHDLAARHELLIIAAMTGATLMAALVGVCIILGWGWAHIAALLS